MLRKLARVAGGVGVILPVVIIGAWGTTYVIACLLALTAPGVPLEYAYTTPAGDLKLRAETYSFDYRMNVLKLTKVSVREPDGRLLGSIRNLLLRDVIPGRRPVVAEASDIVATLERLPNGRFRIEDFLPTAPQKSESTQPYLVRVRHASVLYLDRTTRPEWRRWTSINQLTLSGAGATWAANAPVRIQDSGVVRVSARSDGQAYLFKFSAASLEAAELSKHLAMTPEGKDLPEWKQLNAESARFTGSGFLKIEPNVPVRWEVDASLLARNFAYSKEARAAEVTAKGTLSPSGFQGRVQALNSGLRSDFVGGWAWDERLTLAGELTASVANPSSLPPLLSRLIPRAATFQGGEFSGWLGFTRQTGITVSGDLRAANFKWQDITAARLTAKVETDKDHLVLKSVSGTIQGSVASGSLAYAMGPGNLSGFIRAPKVELGKTLRRYGLVALDGTADIEAVIFGTATRPQVAFRASGSGSSRQPGYEMRLGQFEASGSYQSNRVDLDRLTLVGPAGSTSANGSWDIRSDAVHANVLSTSVPLQAFFSEIEGSAAFSGTISGNRRKFDAKGQLEVFGAKVAGQDIPFARGDVVIDRDGLTADRVLAFKRGAQATGRGEIAFKTRAISGLFDVNGIDLSLYPPEGLAGIASITNGRIAGTLDSPNLEAEVQADNILAQGFAVDHLTAKTFIQKGVLRVSESRATVESGIVTGTGTFDTGARRGAFDLTVEKMPLRSLLGSRLSDVSVEGLLNGQLRGAFSDSQLISMSAKAQVGGLKLNDALLGNGEVTADSLDGNAWTGTAFLGDLNSYVQVPQLSYDLSKQTLNADVISDNLQAAVLYDAAKRYLVDADGQSILPDQMIEPLDTLDGKIDLDAQLSGNLNSLDFTLNAFTLGSLVVAGQTAGELVAKGSRLDRVWNIDRLEWTGGPGLFRVNKGTIDERGKAAVDGEVRNFRWSWLATFNPELADVAGRSDVSFLVSGDSHSPEINASLSYEEGSPESLITPWPGIALRVRDPKAKSRRVDLDTVNVKDGGITATGVFNAEGFTGDLSASIPFRYPFNVPDNEPLSVVARIPDRPLASLAQILPWLDSAKTNGTFSAAVQVGGTKSDVTVGGQFALDAKTIGAKGVTSGLEDVALLAKFEKDKATVSARGSSSKGGSFETEGLGFTLDDLESLFSDPTAGFLANRLFGTFRLNGFGLEYLDPKSGPMTASVSGALDLQGSLKQPEVSGAILIDSANLAVPSIETKETARPDSIINPIFNVSVLTTNNLVLRAGTGKFEISGGGKLEGTLGSPVFGSTMVVEKGSVRLPNARIALEPGGTVLVTYRSGSGGTAVTRVEVDLVGRTQITAQSFTGIVERYDITLNIRGDLIAENGLRLSAQSDPSDLSSDRILAILGQRDVLASGPGENFRADRQLQSALLGLALPYFAGSVTEQLASKLGLDYLNIEYNTFDQFSVTAAITLGRDLVLSGRRQLSSPLPGERLKYDLRMSYRPPFKSRALRRFTFSVGTDQDRPWKVSVEYGIRF